MTTRLAALRCRLRPLWPWLRWGTAATLALLLVLDFAFPPPLPKQRDTSTLVVAADGTPLRAFADAEGVWRYPASIDSVSPLYLQALLTYEDRWFWRHPGINPVAIVRRRPAAAWGRIVSGGSTLTMQVARILDPHSRTPWGKLKQMLRAVQLEVHLSKPQILALYLERALRRHHRGCGGRQLGLGKAGGAAVTCRGRVAGSAAGAEPAASGPPSGSSAEGARQGAVPHGRTGRVDGGRRGRCAHRERGRTLAAAAAACRVAGTAHALGPSRPGTHPEQHRRRLAAHAGRARGQLFLDAARAYLGGPAGGRQPDPAGACLCRHAGVR